MVMHILLSPAVAPDLLIAVRLRSSGQLLVRDVDPVAAQRGS
jgi:hypothetical protein